MYGEYVLTVRQNCLAKFRFGNFDIESAPRSGKIVKIDTIKSVICSPMSRKLSISAAHHHCRQEMRCL